MPARIGELALTPYAMQRQKVNTALVFMNVEAQSGKQLAGTIGGNLFH